MERSAEHRWYLWCFETNLSFSCKGHRAAGKTFIADAQTYKWWKLFFVERNSAWIICFNVILINTHLMKKHSHGYLDSLLLLALCKSFCVFGFLISSRQLFFFNFELTMLNVLTRTASVRMSLKFYSVFLYKRGGQSLLSFISELIIKHSTTQNMSNITSSIWGSGQRALMARFLFILQVKLAFHFCREAKNSHDCLSVHLRKKQEQPLFYNYNLLKLDKSCNLKQLIHHYVITQHIHAAKAGHFFIPWVLIFQLYIWLP